MRLGSQLLRINLSIRFLALTFKPQSARLPIFTLARAWLGEVCESVLDPYHTKSPYFQFIRYGKLVLRIPGKNSMQVGGYHI